MIKLTIKLWIFAILYWLFLPLDFVIASIIFLTERYDNWRMGIVTKYAAYKRADKHIKKVNHGNYK